MDSVYELSKLRICDDEHRPLCSQDSCGREHQPQYGLSYSTVSSSTNWVPHSAICWPGGDFSSGWEGSPSSRQKAPPRQKKAEWGTHTGRCSRSKARGEPPPYHLELQLQSSSSRLSSQREIPLNDWLTACSQVIERSSLEDSIALSTAALVSEERTGRQSQSLSRFILNLHNPTNHC